MIATSTKLDISSVKVDEKFTDEYFKGDRKSKKAATESALLGATFEKKPVTAERAADQKTLDSMLLPLVKKQPMMSQYLNASFALSKGQYPHSIKY